MALKKKKFLILIFIFVRNPQVLAKRRSMNHLNQLPRKIKDSERIYLKMNKTLSQKIRLRDINIRGIMLTYTRTRYNAKQLPKNRSWHNGNGNVTMAQTYLILKIMSNLYTFIKFTNLTSLSWGWVLYLSLFPPFSANLSLPVSCFLSHVKIQSWENIFI